MVNYYKVLGVPQDASFTDIQNAYCRLAHQIHRDKNPDSRKLAENLKKIAKAYEILSDIQKRNNYDKSRRSCIKRENGEDKKHSKKEVFEEFEKLQDDLPGINEAEDLLDVNSSTGQVGYAKRFHSSFFDLATISDTGFSTFVPCGSKSSSNTSGTLVPFVSSGMNNFRLVTTCNLIVNGKKVITQNVLKNIKGNTKVEKENLFHQTLSHHQ